MAVTPNNLERHLERVTRARIIDDLKQDLAPLGEDAVINAAIAALGPLSEPEVGQILGLSRSRIQQIQALAMWKLRVAYKHWDPGCDFPPGMDAVHEGRRVA